jgi:hypothetical protein
LLSFCQCIQICFKATPSRLIRAIPSTSGPDAQVRLSAVANLIVLNFQRAYALLNIAYALPAGDPRIPVFRTLTAMNANRGYAELGSAGCEGQHWLAIYALLYENAASGPAPLVPKKPKTTSGARRDAAPDDAPPGC